MGATTSSPVYGLPFERAPSDRHDRPALRSFSVIEEVPRPEQWLNLLACSKCGFLVTDGYLLCKKEGHITCNTCWRDWSFCGEGDLVCHFPVSFDTPTIQHYIREVGQDYFGDVENPNNSKGTTDHGITSHTGPSEVKIMKHFEDVTGEGQWNNVMDDKILKEVSESSGAIDAPPELCGSVLKRQTHWFIENLLSTIELACPYWKEGCDESIPAKEIRAHYTIKCPYSKYNQKPRNESTFVPPADRTLGNEAKIRLTSQHGATSFKCEYIPNQGPINLDPEQSTKQSSDLPDSKQGYGKKPFSRKVSFNATFVNKTFEGNSFPEGTGGKELDSKKESSEASQQKPESSKVIKPRMTRLQFTPPEL